MVTLNTTMTKIISASIFCPRRAEITLATNRMMTSGFRNRCNSSKCESGAALGSRVVGAVLREPRFSLLRGQADKSSRKIVECLWGEAEVKEPMEPLASDSTFSGCSPRYSVTF